MNCILISRDAVCWSMEYCLMLLSLMVVLVMVVMVVGTASTFHLYISIYKSLFWQKELPAKSIAWTSLSGLAGQPSSWLENVRPYQPSAPIRRMEICKVWSCRLLVDCVGVVQVLGDGVQACLGVLVFVAGARQCY